MSATKKMMIDLDDIITTHEASKILGITQNRVQAMVRSKIIKFSRQIGQKIFILSKNEVEALSKVNRPRGNPNWIKKVDVVVKKRGRKPKVAVIAPVLDNVESDAMTVNVTIDNKVVPVSKPIALMMQALSV